MKFENKGKWLQQITESKAQRNEGNFKDDATSLKDAQVKLNRAKDELKEAIAQKDFSRQQRFKSDIKYYEDLIKYIKANPVKESSQKNEALNLDKLTDADAKQLIMYLNDFIKDKASKYYYIDKIEAILKKSYKAESSIKNEAKIVNMSNACSMQNINHLSDEQMAIQYKVPIDVWKRAKVLFKGQQSSTYGNKPKDFVNFDKMTLESVQKNEASSLQALNKELANNVENLYVMAKHVRDRFKYRTLQNMSYDEAQAEKIYDQIEDVIEDAVKKLAAINSKVIG